MIKKDTICIIPARSGSKGIKNKNIQKFGSKPLLLHSCLFAKKLKFLKKIIISTDSNKYLNVCKKYGFNNSQLRPKRLSGDNIPTSDVVKYELSRLSTGIKKKIRYVLILQPTCPFRQVKDFIYAHQKLKLGFKSVITVNKVTEHPHRMMLKSKKNELKNYSNKVNFIPRQKLENVYLRSGSMYFHNISLFKNKKFNLGNKVYGIEVYGKNKVNIDTPKDYKLALSYL